MGWMLEAQCLGLAPPPRVLPLSLHLGPCLHITSLLPTLSLMPFCLVLPFCCSEPVGWLETNMETRKIWKTLFSVDFSRVPLELRPLCCRQGVCVRGDSQRALP